MNYLLFHIEKIINMLNTYSLSSFLIFQPDLGILVPTYVFKAGFLYPQHEVASVFRQDSYYPSTKVASVFKARFLYPSMKVASVWALTRETLSSGVCEQQTRRSAWANLCV